MRATRGRNLVQGFVGCISVLTMAAAMIFSVIGVVLAIQAVLP
jgi:hypothetical protein